jgi:hypothetical protein
MNENCALNNKLKEYIDLVINTFKLLKKEHDNHKLLYLPKGKQDLIKKGVKKLESGDTYADLEDIFLDWIISCKWGVLLNLPEDRRLNPYTHGGPPEADFLLQHFFRRSLFYVKCFNNEEIDIEEMINWFNNVFFVTDINVRYIAPLEFVKFNTNKPMHFGSFSIRQFSKQELDNISNNENNAIFFREFIWNTDILSKYWFLDINNVKIPINDLLRDDEEIYYVRKSISKNLQPIQDIIYSLILYNWYDPITYWEKMPCQSINIPFIIRIDDYPLIYPDFPDVTDLKTVIDYKEKRNPVIYFHLDKHKTNSFQKHTKKTIKLIQKDIFEKPWEFMKIALDYFQKAVFIHDDSKVREQFLFYLMAIEALLSENTGGSTRILTGRISRILGKDYTERISKGNEFKNKVYDKRSDIIHGRHVDDNKIANILNMARDYSQNACLWYLEYLNGILEINKNNNKLIDKSHILKMIDLGPDEITKNLFKEFPYIEIK